MREKVSSIKSCASNHGGSLLNSNISESVSHPSKTSQNLLSFYKTKSEKLEKDYENLLEILEQVKSSCDLSNELQKELTERNEEVSKLQQLVGELQIHLFREKEQNLKLSAENDMIRIQEYENKKRIKSLLMLTGMCERKFYHFVTQETTMPINLPDRCSKIKASKCRDYPEKAGNDSEIVDPQALLLNNQLLASQLDHHIKLTRDEINVLLKEKEMYQEERNIERRRLQDEIHLLSSKLRESQNLLFETTEKLIKLKHKYEKEKTIWAEDKERYKRSIDMLKDMQGVDVSDILGFCMNKGSHCKARSNERNHYSSSEKEERDAVYQEQILALETEVNQLRERAQACKNRFREKTEKMTALVSYLKKKYEELDNRRKMEGEGFRTDIRMLRERVKDLEKKLKGANNMKSSEQQQLLVSARNTLNRARLLEKELACMKSKMSALQSNETVSSL